MFKKKKGAEGADDQPKSGGKSNLVPAAVLAVGLLGGGFLMKPSPAPAAAAEPAAVAEAAEDEAQGPIHALEPITLNLSDGHFLKVGLALQMAPHEGAEAGGHGGEEAPEMPAGEQAKALDAAIAMFGAHTMAEVTDPAVREQLKQELTERVGEAYHGEVTGVYYMEFVVQ